MPDNYIPLGEDPRERVDAIRRLRERNKKTKNQLDQINDDYENQRDGLSKRNRDIFGD